MIRKKQENVKNELSLPIKTSGLTVYLKSKTKCGVGNLMIMCVILSVSGACSDKNICDVYWATELSLHCPLESSEVSLSSPAKAARLPASSLPVWGPLPCCFTDHLPLSFPQEEVTPLPAHGSKAKVKSLTL